MPLLHFFFLSLLLCYLFCMKWDFPIVCCFHECLKEIHTPFTAINDVYVASEMRFLLLILFSLPCFMIFNKIIEFYNVFLFLPFIPFAPLAAVMHFASLPQKALYPSKQDSFNMHLTYHKKLWKLHSTFNVHRISFFFCCFYFFCLSKHSSTFPSLLYTCLSDKLYRIKFSLADRIMSLLCMHFIFYLLHSLSKEKNSIHLWCGAKP